MAYQGAKAGSISAFENSPAWILKVAFTEAEHGAKSCPLERAGGVNGLRGVAP